MSVGDIFELGKQGLAANRQAIQTTSNNIANVNTPGFTRQRAVLESRPQMSTEGVMIGGGVDVTHVIRVHDQFVEKQLLEESKPLGTARSKVEGLRLVEDLFNSGGMAVGEAVGKFFDAYRDLSANPEMASTRTEVIERAKSAVHNFQSVAQSLEDVRKGMDLKLDGIVKQVNSNVQELADLNRKINQFELTGQSPNELLDRRDQVVRSLSEALGYPTVSNDQGHVYFPSPAMASLFDGVYPNELVLMRAPEREGKRAGAAEIYLKDRNGVHDVMASFKEGQIAGLIDIRDRVIGEVEERLDHAAYQFATKVNEVHRKGYGTDGGSERDLFKVGEGPHGTSSIISLSDDAKRSSDVIAVGLKNGAPGDNRIALEITDLQSMALMPSNGMLSGDDQHLEHTIGESLNNMVGLVASETASNEQVFRHQEAIVGQLENYKDSVSGVSLEEEAINLMKYQAAFNATVKTMKVGDEMLQTILSLKD